MPGEILLNKLLDNYALDFKPISFTYKLVLKEFLHGHHVPYALGANASVSDKN